MRLSILKEIGPHCIIQADGLKIYEKIHEPLKKGEEVILDFDGVLHVATPFFNFAIGELLKDIPKADVRQHLQIEHISEAGKLAVEREIENAARYHTDKKYRRAVDKVMKRQMKEANE